jgi:hypothetical protein
VDRQRRAPAVSMSPLNRRGARSRWADARLSWSLALVVTLATLVVSSSGCKNRKEEARQRAELTQALDQYKAQIGELQRQASGLRARFDNLPDDLPGLGPVRDDLHALEEGLGVEDGRGKWLSGELDKAFASGNQEQIEAVRKAIPRGADGFSESVVKVTHELMPYERLAGQRRYFEELDAAKAREARKASR